MVRLTFVAVVEALLVEMVEMETRMSPLILAVLAALAAVFVLLVLARPDHILEKSRLHVLNALVVGGWSTAWILVAALALAAPLLGRMPHQGFVWFGVVGYLIVTFDLTYFGYWRQGWGDSGNRMLTHVLPTIAWAMMVNGAVSVPKVSPVVEPGPAKKLGSRS